MTLHLLRNLLKAKFKLPSQRDTPRTFVAKRARAEAKITPLSLIHPATANALLIMGAKRGTGNVSDCFFGLHQFLIWSGASALSLYVLSVISKYILWWILNSVPSRADRVLLLIIEIISLLLALVEVVALSICSAFLYPEISRGINFEDPSDPRYCEYGMVMFSVIFFTMMWVLILLALVAFVFIACVRALGYTRVEEDEGTTKDVEKGTRAPLPQTTRSEPTSKMTIGPTPSPQSQKAMMVKPDGATTRRTTKRSSESSLLRW